MKVKTPDPAAIPSPLNAHYRPEVKSESTNKKYRSGKKTALKKESPNRDRSRFSRLAIRQLEQFITEAGLNFNALRDQNFISDELVSIIEDFVKSVYITIDKTLKPTQKGAPPTLRCARDLRLKIDAFENVTNELIQRDGTNSQDLKDSLKELAEDVRHYIRQIELTYGIVNPKNSKPNWPNRPANYSAITALVEIIEDHRSENGVKASLKPQKIQILLAASGHTVPDRTIRYWRRNVLKI